ncbi:polymeric immunoglobulin receptor-like [Odontesthes bonariensis]|uniref:polymeric immunoglobulin receptor-like n=1 Tax=Odontesthes bonariensis TaxID=219752 RepID=UPI003F5888D5
MAFPYFLLVILTGLMGFRSEIKTVSKVAVTAGGSISIPCLYEQSYREQVKYLCKGYVWLFCDGVIATKPKKLKNRSGRFSISDDTNQRTFTVTINDVTNKDKYFSCAVTIEKKKDVRQLFELSVTSGASGLYVTKQEITGFERGSVTVACHCENAEVTQWCRLGSTCVTHATGFIDGTTVMINTSISGIFSVTLSDLKTESSGWYWCANEKLQMPVHITVHKLASTTTMLTTTSTVSPNQTSFTGPVKPYTALPLNSTMTEAGGSNIQDEHKSTTKVNNSHHHPALTAVDYALCLFWLEDDKAQKDQT